MKVFLTMESLQILLKIEKYQALAMTYDLMALKLKPPWCCYPEGF